MLLKKLPKTFHRASKKSFQKSFQKCYLYWLLVYAYIIGDCFDGDGGGPFPGKNILRMLLSNSSSQINSSNEATNTTPTASQHKKNNMPR